MLMNYYPFHPGDYLRDTAHLDPMEDLTYRRLLDMYYLSEKPIPLETDLVSRRLRLGSDVVLSVLREFFVETLEGWTHRRCDMEIAAYMARSERAKKNGKAGGRPKKTQQVISGLATETQEKTNQNQNQNQEPKEKKHTLAKPDVSEVVAYCQEIGLPAADGVAVFDKWTGSGWKNGGQAIKDWKATIRAWKAQGYMPSQKRGSSAYGRPQATHNGRPPSCL